MKSPAAKAKNDKKFFEKLARKNNPIRGKRVVLPDNVNLTDIDWKPDFAERGFLRLAEIDRKFEQAEKEYRKARISILEQMRDADLKRIRELS